jgi:hypothetical protein
MLSPSDPNSAILSVRTMKKEAAEEEGEITERNSTKRNVEVDKTERTLGRRTGAEINRIVKGKKGRGDGKQRRGRGIIKRYSARNMERINFVFFVVFLLEFTFLQIKRP